MAIKTQKQLVSQSNTLTLKPNQSKVIESPSRFKVLIAGRRFGKTVGAIGYLLEGASTANTLNWYVAPTYRQAKQICWRKLKEIVPYGVWTNANETELTMTLFNGSIIQLKGADNPDSLRGVGLNRLVVDEFPLVDPLAWVEVLRPALADKQGEALFIGTPNGLGNWGYDLFLRGQKDNPDWRSWKFTTIDGGNVTAQEIESARKDLDDRTFRQEFLASFEALSNRVYYCFDRILNNSFETIRSGEPLHIGCDFNIGKVAAVTHVIRSRYPVAVDEIIDCYDTPDLIRLIKDRYPRHTINIYPDASGAQRNTNAGQTDLQLLKQAGFNVIVNLSNPPVRDRVNAMNAGCHNAAGERRYRVNVAKCPRYTEALEQQGYDKNGMPNKSGDDRISHVLDAGGYLVCKLMPIAGQGSAPVVAGKITQPAFR